MDIIFYARLYRVRPLELRLCQTSCLCIHGITITLKFFFFFFNYCSFLSLLSAASAWYEAEVHF